LNITNSSCWVLQGACWALADSVSSLDSALLISIAGLAVTSLNLILAEISRVTAITGTLWSIWGIGTLSTVSTWVVARAQLDVTAISDKA